MAITDDQMDELRALATTMGGEPTWDGLQDATFLATLMARAAEDGMRTQDEYAAEVTVEDLPAPEDRRDLVDAWRAARRARFEIAMVAWAQGHEPDVDALGRPYGAERFAAVYLKSGHVIACTVMLDVDVEMEVAIHGAPRDLAEQRHVDWYDGGDDRRRIWNVQAALPGYDGDQGYDAMGGICAESPAHALSLYLRAHTLPAGVPRATWTAPTREDVAP
jgi:hypothetical protein